VQINYPVASGVDVTGIAATGRIVVDGTINHEPSGHRSTFAAGLIQSIRVIGDDRANWIELRSLPVKKITVESRGGDDQIYGGEAFTGYTAKSIHVFAGDGSDWVEASQGDDVIYAGRGNDNCRAYNGDDKLYGEAGNDALHGGYGSDTFVGGDGVDSIFGVSVDYTAYGEGYGWPPDPGIDVVYYQVGGAADHEDDIELRFPLLEVPPLLP
jgi:Ca2+-binding RTX toxin-like protein